MNVVRQVGDGRSYLLNIVRVSVLYGFDLDPVDFLAPCMELRRYFLLFVDYELGLSYGRFEIDTRPAYSCTVAASFS